MPLRAGWRSGWPSWWDRTRRGAGGSHQECEALERLEKVDTLIVDKTGTLTEGKPKLAHVSAAGPFTEEDVLRFAAAVEQASEHPLAAAIVAGARERGVPVPSADSFNSLTGRGVSGMVQGRLVLLGNRRLMDENRVDVTQLGGNAEQQRSEGQTVMFLAVDGQPAGTIGAADPIKGTTAEAIRMLHADGLRVVMLTGDNEGTAQAVASRLKIDEVIADVQPGEAGGRPAHADEGRVVEMAGTASTMRRHSLRRPSALRWAPAPMSRSRAPASRSSRVTCAPSSAPGDSVARR